MTNWSHLKPKGVLVAAKIKKLSDYLDSLLSLSTSRQEMGVSNVSSKDEEALKELIGTLIDVLADYEENKNIGSSVPSTNEQIKKEFDTFTKQCESLYGKCKRMLSSDEKKETERKMAKEKRDSQSAEKKQSIREQNKVQMREKRSNEEFRKQDNVQNCKTKERHQKAEEDTNQSRFRLA